MSSDNLLRFSLGVPREKQVHELRRLHLFAQEQMFLGVSQVVSFEGSECKIGHQDPAAAIKRQAQGIALANGRLLSFLPERFSGFGCQLPNRRLMFIGFAEYPDTVTTSTGQSFATPWKDKAYWHSTAFTLDPRFIRSPDDCSESHRIACDLLKYADDIKVLRVVEDNTGFFNHPDSVRIDCDGELEIHALGTDSGC